MMHTIFYEPGGRFFRDRCRTPTTCPSPRKLRAATPTISYASRRFIVSARQWKAFVSFLAIVWRAKQVPGNNVVTSKATFLANLESVKPYPWTQTPGRGYIFLGCMVFVYASISERAVRNHTHTHTQGEIPTRQ